MLWICGSLKAEEVSKTSQLQVATDDNHPVETIPFSKRDYTFGYWKHGYRKHRSDRSPDILAIETGRFGLLLDMAKLDQAKFGFIVDDRDYQSALVAGDERLQRLQGALLHIDLEMGGKRYRAVSCLAAKERVEGRRFQATRLWESGRYMQHYEIGGLVFKSADSEELETDSRLRVVVWPDSFAFTVEVSPSSGKVQDIGARPVWENAKLCVRFKGSGLDMHEEKHIKGRWLAGQKQSVTINHSQNPDRFKGIKIGASMKLNKLPAVKYNREFGCYVARVNRPKRSWQGGYKPLRNYDEIDIVVEAQETKTVPFMLEMFGPANVVGVCTILCDEDGIPTGIPVQLSKNWHERKMGKYVRAAALLPVVKGVKQYKLRFVYGFYGKLPSASHAQLSLVGYGGNGRWDQLAIGSWGETYCMDLDMSCVDVAVTDVRMLMARNGLEGKKWSWTDAGWGGDWLGLSDQAGDKLLFNQLKTAYMSHGPCLTEAQYDGYYGASRQVELSSVVRTLRTDDYARTFSTLRYDFKKSVNADGWLFKMGRTARYVTPKIAYGNGEGLINEQTVPEGLKLGEAFIKPTTLTGGGPWWVAFPGAYHHKGKDWGTGYRALVIRGFAAKIGGKEYKNPTVAFRAYRSAGQGKPNLDFMITAPAGVSGFEPGDYVLLDLEWITLPRVADDYYGPNEMFRKHLEANPSSWKTTHREAKGNNLLVGVAGGVLQNTYPIIIEAHQSEVEVDIRGGVGYVPIRFEGLAYAKGYRLYRKVGIKEEALDQSVHGNDFWQTDYDVNAGSYRITYNLPLDGLKRSKWVLRRMEGDSESDRD